MPLVPNLYLLDIIRVSPFLVSRPHLEFANTVPSVRITLVPSPQLQHASLGWSSNASARGERNSPAHALG